MLIGIAVVIALIFLWAIGQALTDISRSLEDIRQFCRRVEKLPWFADQEKLRAFDPRRQWDKDVNNIIASPSASAQL